MKLLTLLFALYVLLLPCIPCTDTDECKDSFKTDLTAASSTHDNDQHENEACNPFCSCTCCGNIFTSNFHPEKVALNKPSESLKKQSFYKNIYLPSDFFGNIWQPPKYS